MLESVQSREKTNEEKLLELKQEVGKAFFDYGRLKYEIEIKEKQLGNISVNLHNLNHKCISLEEDIQKAEKLAAMKVDLAPPAVMPEIPGQ